MRILRLHSELTNEEMRPILDEMDAIAIRAGLAGSLEEIGLAEHLARSAFAKKTNIARSIRYEFLLWLCGKNDIRSAMGMSAPKDGDEFFTIVFSDTGPEAVCRMLSASERPLALTRESDPLALERISLSRIG